MPVVLLHVCCGPDATVPLPSLAEEGYRVVGYFNGNNIHPEEEYRKRRGAVETVFAVCEAAVLFPDYDPASWDCAVKGYEDEQEGGARCLRCFREQFFRASQAAVSEGCEFLCTTLTISPHKDPDRINAIGGEVARAAGILWLSRVFRKNGGFQKSLEHGKRLKLYRQSYCGCRYSLRGDDDRE